MTMTAKEQLLQIRDLDAYIQTLQDELEVLLARLTSTTSKPKEVNVQSSKEDKTPETIEKVIEMRSEINALIDEYVDLKADARKVIEKIRPLSYQCVLLKYYFQRKTFEQVAVEMGKSYQWICELNDRALKEFEKIQNISNS